MNKEQLESLIDEIEMAGMDRHKSPQAEAHFQMLVDRLTAEEQGGTKATAKAEEGPTSGQWQEVVEALKAIAANPVQVVMPSTLEISKMPSRQITTVVDRDERGRAKGTITREKDV